MEAQYDLIIAGGGPGGVAAGVYAARKKIKTLLIAEEFGGQSLVSADIQNWIGTKSVSGFDFAKMLAEHVRAQEDLAVIEGDRVVKMENDESGFRLTTKSGKEFRAKYVLIATGSRRRKLNIPGEQEWEGKGVMYCSICDAPLFKGKTVAVVGGGNAGLEAVLDLNPYAPRIYLLEYADRLKGDPVTEEKVRKNPNVEVILRAAAKEIQGGEKGVTGLVYVDRASNAERTLDVGGVFVEIGAVPNSDFAKDLVETNSFGEIVVDHKTQRTSRQGIWAAGDVSDVRYKQNNISAGDAVKAVLDIYDTINKE